MAEMLTGLVPDGETDCTAALQAAVDQGPVRLPAGRYRLSRPVTIDLATHGPGGISSDGGATLIQTGRGPALRVVGSHRGTASPDTVSPITFGRERLPLFDGLEIVGEHPEADGLELSHCFKPVLRGLLIRQCRVGVRLAERNRDVLIADCHIYDNRAQGIFLDKVNLHQINITGCHISYNRAGGIVSFGSEIRNLQIAGCDIEYNYNPDDLTAESADIWIETRGGSVREGSITGCTIQALPTAHGANIRFVGEEPRQSHKVGFFSIAGNLISSQECQIHLRFARGVVISGNSFYSGAGRTILAEASSRLALTGNLIDHNPDYKGDWQDGIELSKVLCATLTGNILSSVAHPEAALRIVDCDSVTVGSNQVVSPNGTGIWVTRSKSVQILNTTVRDPRSQKRMPYAVRLEETQDTELLSCQLEPGHIGVVGIDDEPETRLL